MTHEASAKKAGSSGVHPPAQMKVINQNQQLMDDLGANATPAIYYMNKDKILQQVVYQSATGRHDGAALTQKLAKLELNRTTPDSATFVGQPLTGINATPDQHVIRHSLLD